MKARCAIKAPDAGLTLVEVVVAIAIFAIGTLAVGSMHTTALRSTTTSRENTEASALAADQLERLIRLSRERRDTYYGYRDAPELQDSDLDHTGGLDDTTTQSADHRRTANAGYQIYWNVAVDQPMDGTKTIRIIVVWNDRGAERRYPLEYIAVDII